MIWATVHSRSCFCWLYRASPPSAANNKINLNLELTIWWCPCVELSLVYWECLLWPMHSLGKTLLAFALLHFVLQGQTCLLLVLSLDFLLLHSSRLWWKGHLFWVFVSSRMSYRSSQNHSASASSALVVGAWTWISVILNGLTWKGTEVIL